MLAARTVPRAPLCAATLTFITCTIVFASVAQSAWSPWPKIIPADVAAGDRFGFSVATFGDYTIVGAPLQDGPGGGGNAARGAAYIYQRAGETWVQTQKLVPATLVGGDDFGWSVDISDSVAIVGTDAPTGGSGNGGFAYIFELVNGTWVEKTRLSPSGLGIFDQFGYSVAVDGRMAVVGAPGTDFGAGKIYIYYRDDAGNWYLEQTLQFGNIPGDRLGTSVDVTKFWICCDLGVSEYRVVAGAPGRDFERGTVYMASHAFMTGGWASTSFTASNAAVGDRFGESISLDGYWDQLLLVGAPNASRGAANTGTAYLFEDPPSGTMTELYEFYPADVAAGDGFGSSVDIAGDTGQARMLVASPWNSEGAYQAGSAYLFMHASPTAQQLEKFVAADAQYGDQFGHGLSIDEVAWKTAFVGSPYDDDRGSYTGSVYPYTDGTATLMAGTKFDDVDGNGVRDPGEPGIPGERIFLDTNGNGVYDAGEASDITDANGDYAFRDQPLGSYSIRNEVAGQWVQTLPSPAAGYDVTLVLGTTLTDMDFGVHLNVNTPTGTNVSISPDPSVDITFGNVTGAGNTTVSTSTTNPGPGVTGFQFLGTYYDIQTTATYTGTVEICLNYDDTGMSFAEEIGLRLFHYEGGVWIDVTTSLDTAANIICGTVTSLSPFGIAKLQPWIADSTSPGVEDPDNGVSVSWVDYDMDGDDDLYLVDHLSPDHLMRNDGGGVFVDVTTAPLGDAGQGSAGCWADYDNDGDPDLYLTVRQAPNRLYRNDGASGFTEITGSPVNDPSDSHEAQWADVDNDGDLDLFVSNYGQANKLFRNDGEGGFVDATPSVLASSGFGQGAAFGDYDDDGDADLYLANSGAEANHLYRNDGNWQWTDVTTAPLADTNTGRGVAWADYDNDGDLDLYLANDGQANKLFRNDGGGSFVDVAGGILADANNAREIAWADYDNDGDLDLYLTNLNQPNKLFRNMGAGAFSDGTVAPLDDPGYSIGAAWSDYDGDGDVDLYVANAFGPSHLYRNDQLGNNHWLHVKLHGVISNSQGVGARVRVVAGGTSQIREVNAGGGFLSQCSISARFGLGSATVVDTLEVRWPSGIVNRFTRGVGVDRVVEVGESQGDATGFGDSPATPRITRLENPTPNPFNPRTRLVFELAHGSKVTLRIYDVAGRLVRTLVDGRFMEPGRYVETWDGTDRHGGAVASGVYRARLEADGKVLVKAMSLVR